MNKIPAVELLILLCGTFGMAFINAYSGRFENGSLLLYSIHARDSVYHLSLIGSLMHAFPPMHPALSGIPLRGYNFFYDFLIAEIAMISRINRIDLFFRFFPVLISFIYGLSFLALGRFLKLNRRTTAIFLFLGFFANDISFLMPLFFGNAGAGYSAGIVQSLNNITDASVVLSIPLVFSGLMLYSSENKKAVCISALCFAVLPQIKIYTAVIAFAGLGGTAMYYLYKKNFFHLFILLVTGIFAGIMYLPVNAGTGGLLFAPFLIYQHFMESVTFISSYQWILKLRYYESTKNFVHIVYLYAIACGLFFIPTLGVRLISLGFLPQLLRKKFYTPQNIFFFWAIAASFLLPTFFIQSVAVFVIVQFLWIGYILLLLPTAIAFERIFGKAKRFIWTLAFSVLILFSLPGNYSLLHHFTADKHTIDSAIVGLGNKLAYSAQEETALVLNRKKVNNTFSDEYETPELSAISGHSVYYEPTLAEFSTISTVVKKRQTDIDTIIQSLNNCTPQAKKNIETFLQREAIEYVASLSRFSCLSELPFLQKQYEHDSTVLYKVSVQGVRIHI